jgi:hypothetical protein
MHTFQETGIWKRVFDPSTSESQTATGIREQLKTAYNVARERAVPIAQRIAADLPEYTLHDISHLDALWEIADLIVGPEYPMTPVEGFLLGSAFLIHDLGLGLSAFPEGLQTVKDQTLWRDQVALKLREKLGRAPMASEIANPDESISIYATRNTLRLLHARRSEELARIYWQDKPSDPQYFLIDNPELRNAYASLIGKIAHSHWWPIEQLERAFPEKLGSPAFLDCPPTWTTDPLKLACILRAADVAHLDSRRAPGFQKALRKPTGISAQHWGFQEHLHKPHVIADRLMFSCASPFGSGDSGAWWQCLDALTDVDRELRSVDALLSDTKRERFRVRGVAGVDDPKRLSRLIPTKDWTPIDARLKVSNVVKLVDRLGGKELYGDDIRAGLRELIQNAQDAINVRRAIDKDFSGGTVVVSLRSEEDRYYLEVEDDGVGMSPEVLTGSLLDFGNSFWDSQAVLEEFPGLLSSQFFPVGRFGIGFFSVFMLGDEVTVLSRRFDAARSDTRVLQFPEGLTSRAVLRDATPNELLGNASTVVRVRLKKDPRAFAGLLWFEDEYRGMHAYGSLKDTCTWLCPALAVNLWTKEEDTEKEKVVAAHDWLDLPPEKLIKRVWKFHDEVSTPEVRARFKILQKAFRPICDSNGKVVGRGCIFPDSDLHPTDYDRGVVTVGGLRSTFLGSIAGVFDGTPVTAARDDARVIATPQQMADWATEQGKLIMNLELLDRVKMHAAGIVHAYGGKIGNLPFCLTHEGFLNVETFRNWAASLNEIRIIGWYDSLSSAERFPGWKLDKRTLLTDNSQPNHFESEYDTLGLSLEREDYLKLPTRIRNLYFYSKASLVEVVLLNLAQQWNMSPLSLFRNSRSRWDEEVIIGECDHGPVFGTADVFCREGQKRVRSNSK